uniref:Uncharacterized protein n=1 Tax=Globodera rostochiensis TaxID=31243 RepID=A0A914H6V7_GLORO
MAKIGLCAKVCWFIYAQSVLLQLVHHNQRANAAGLKVYISPTGIHYHVNVYGTQNGNYGKIATAETKTEHPSEREIAVLNKKKFDGVTDVRFSFTPTNQQDNLVHHHQNANDVNILESPGMAANTTAIGTRPLRLRHADFLSIFYRSDLRFSFFIDRICASDFLSIGFALQIFYRSDLRFSFNYTVQIRNCKPNEILEDTIDAQKQYFELDIKEKECLEGRLNFVIKANSRKTKVPKVKTFEFHSNFLKRASSIFVDIAKPRQIVLSTNYSTSKDIESGGLAIVEAIAYCNMEQKPTDIIVFGNSAGHQNSESFALPVANLAMSKNCTERTVLLEILLNDGTSRILYVHEPDFGTFKTINVNLETAAASMTSDSLFDKVQNLLG